MLCIKICLYVPIFHASFYFHEKNNNLQVTNNVINTICKAPGRSRKTSHLNKNAPFLCLHDSNDIFFIYHKLSS